MLLSPCNALPHGACASHAAQVEWVISFQSSKKRKQVVRECKKVGRASITQAWQQSHNVHAGIMRKVLDSTSAIASIKRKATLHAAQKHTDAPANGAAAASEAPKPAPMTAWGSPDLEGGERKHPTSLL